MQMDIQHSRFVVILHKTSFYGLMLIAAVWSVVALWEHWYRAVAGIDLWLMLGLFYVLMFSVSAWLVTYVDLIDFGYSLSGKNGKFYRSLAIRLQEQIFIPALLVVAMVAVYWSDTVPYSFEALDIGWLGLPWLALAGYNCAVMLNQKIHGRPVRKTPILAYAAAIICFTVIAFRLLVKNSSGEFTTLTAIWLQVTLICTSFSFYMSTQWMRHALNEERIELSAFKKSFFTQIARSKRKLYVSMEWPAEELNARMKRKKSIRAAAKRKRQKR